MQTTSKLVKLSAQLTISTLLAKNFSRCRTKAKRLFQCQNPQVRIVMLSSNSCRANLMMLLAKLLSSPMCLIIQLQSTRRSTITKRVRSAQWNLSLQPNKVDIRLLQEMPLLAIRKVAQVNLTCIQHHRLQARAADVSEYNNSTF